MRILLVEDDAATRRGISHFLAAAGHAVTQAADGLAALDLLETCTPELVVSDIRMPGLDGLGLLARLRAHDTAPAVLMMTAFATVEEAVGALQAGARDYLTKPLNLGELGVKVCRIEEELRLRRENLRLRERLQCVEHPELVGAGKAMAELRKTLLRAAADGAVPVMIYGESGTGKELVARTLHAESPRAAAAFVDVSCAAFSDELLESELFGYRKGAFTGAYRDKKGIVEAAAHGTLFLDEVSEMSPRMQSKLLRFLQEHTVMAVGATSATAVDVRVVGASNVDLHEMALAGRFREDLYYRLNVMEVRLPPLRARVEDIAGLVGHFLRKHGGRELRFTRACWDVLEHHAWPGNVRELENLVRVLQVSCDGQEVDVHDLPVRIRAPRAEPAAAGELAEGTLHDALARCEERMVRAELKRQGGNVSRTAQALGLSRVGLYKKLKQHGIAL